MAEYIRDMQAFLYFLGNLIIIGTLVVAEFYFQKYLGEDEHPRLDLHRFPGRRFGGLRGLTSIRAGVSLINFPPF